MCLVHGDWSPKNLLVANGRVIAIDFEVVHFGDPSFDTAFLLNHLALKAIHKPQWTSRYRRCAAGFFGAALQHLPPDAGWMEGATLRHLGGLMLARVDGKSPVEYLSAEERTRVRQLARELILQPPESVDAVFEKIGE